MFPQRRIWVYSLIGLVWLVLLAWQVIEHRRVVASARESLISRGRDITTTLGLVLRSQRRWGGIVSKERLESAVKELIKPGEVRAIMLLNAENEVVVAAGEQLDEMTILSTPSGVSWSGGDMLLANLVDLGTNTFSTNSEPRRAIVVPFSPPPGTEGGSNVPPFGFRPPPPPGEPNDEFPFPRETRAPDADRAPGERIPAERPIGVGEPLNPAMTLERPSPPPAPPRDGDNRQRVSRSRTSSFGRPPWMKEEEYRALIANAGLHSFIIVMSAAVIENAALKDLQVRVLMLLLATVAAVGAGLAWRSFQQTADLQMRLVKASEMNSHLKQMNLAAAGLAHETRNPLNIIRGLAQIISHQGEAPPKVREQSQAIVEEADRVTAQLNEFINYSRPREVRRTAVPVGRVIGEVARALTYDAEEKEIQFTLPETDLIIEADEQLLRQTLFNLLLNAVQAVDQGGRITVQALRANGGAVIEVRDNGPGVPPERRLDIFKPYFTTNVRGTGLGLAIVQQIVSAHGWEIECLDNEPKGALFRINRVKVTGGSA
jgi:signal transduction histidine kinase